LSYIQQSSCSVVQLQACNDKVKLFELSIYVDFHRNCTSFVSVIEVDSDGVDFGVSHLKSVL